ncbi:MAG: patatin-like phospholipase family protein [Verrucomicrobia bacterium]|nr:patatin-like phospholipase family protein [Verrucomicrobiota bacterium]
MNALDERIKSESAFPETGTFSRPPASPQPVLSESSAHPRLGLALSSGGAKGLAHIGVIQVLEENGIEVDVVSGCSMGAYIAAIWAFGYDGQHLERLARELEGRWGLLHLIDPVIPPRRGFIRGVAVKNRLKKSIGDAQFSDLKHPLRVVATDLNTLQHVVFSSGEVASAVHASIAIPGLCVPVRIGGETYFDGGITDPMPADVLREMNVERVIAVNTIPTPAYMQCCLEWEREQRALRRRRFIVWKLLRRYFNYFARGNILSNLLNSFYGAQMSVAEAGCRCADLVLRPLACDAYWHDFTHPGKYIALGRRVAEEHLDEIKALIGRKDSSYEPNAALNSMAVAA